MTDARRRIAAMAFLVVVQGGFALALLLGARPSAGEPGVDFATYYLAAKGMAAGRDVYRFSEADWTELARENGIESVAPPYRYPPPTAALVSLAAGLPFPTALAAWSVLSVLAFALAAAVLARGAPWEPALLVGSALFVPALATIYTGQVNDLVLLSLALYVALAGARRDVLAGACLGIGVALKPITAPLLAHLLLRRDAPKLLGAAAGMFSGAALGALVVGPSALPDYVRSAWLLSTLSPQEQVVTYPTNQSLLGALGRYAEALGSGPGSARIPWLTIGAIAIAFILFALLRSWGSPLRSFRLETGLLLAAINLLAPVSWYHHLTLALVPLAAAWRSGATWHRVTLLVAFALIGVHGLAWHRLVAQPLLLSLGTYGTALIFAVCAALVFRPPPAEAGA